MTCPLPETCFLCPEPFCCPPPTRCPKVVCRPYVDQCPPCPYIPCCTGPKCEPTSCVEDRYFFLDPCRPLIVHNSIQILKPTSVVKTLHDDTNPGTTYYMNNQDRMMNSCCYDVCDGPRRCSF